MHDDGRDRRGFLRVLGGAAVVVSTAPLTGCPWHHPPAHGAVEAGMAGAYGEGTLHVVDDQPVVLGHDARGLYAMSTICVHKGCDIRSHGEITNQGLHCSCHGSRYDANGIPTHGPADRPLDHYAVVLRDGGDVIIDADQRVAPDVRTPLPQK